MLLLRREFLDGPDRNDLVVIHGTASPADSPGTVLRRFSVVLPGTGDSGRRAARLFLPSPEGGGRIRVRYRFSTVRSGEERFSPPYEIDLSGTEPDGDLLHLPEEGDGNLPPAQGRGTFRLLLPLREGEPGTGTARYGYGAMRKKPSESLCRASFPLDGETPPVIEIPEALSVLKGRPMPYFLYHLTEGGAGLVADKINTARITWQDDAGDVVCARLLWNCGSWAAPNLSPMEVRALPGRSPAAAYPFATDPELFLRERAEALEETPAPRTHEAYLFGPAGSAAEYCFLLLRRLPDGTTAAEWRNLDGGNWSIRL